MKPFFLSPFLFLALLSCNPRQSTKIERAGEPTVYSVQSEDAEMNEAISMAQQTLDKFNAALQSQNPNYFAFAIKKPFKTFSGFEHIWIGNISLKNGKYYGEVNNLPESTNEVKLGDQVEIDPEEVTDWMYIETQTLRGGYTIRLLRNRMTKTERKQFDLENGLIIED